MSNAPHPRPLSPHLGIYKREWTMIYSILHRFTGIGLSGGLILMVLYLFAIALGADAYQMAYDCASSIVGRLVLLAVSFAFFYHLANGLRHLAWDLGKGLALDKAKASGNAVMAGAILLTIAAWAIAYYISG
ncbi:MAG: succinate dehydrogenase, cytochrome b556 subunit [Alphaproteobacteria bacterium]